MQGVYLSGKELSAGGSLRLVGELRVLAHGYRYRNETVGQSDRSGVEGGSLGLGYTRWGWRVEANGTYQESEFSTQSVRHTGQIALGRPLGQLSFTANAELGDEATTTGTYPFRFYRSDLRWTGRAGHLSFGLHSYRSSGAPSRLREDLLGSVVLGEVELAGGTWATRGWSALGEPGVWMHVGLPVAADFTLLLGMEHADQPYALGTSAWRASAGLRKRLLLPLPFLNVAGTER